MLVARRYVVEVDGAVGSLPHARLSSAIEEARTYAGGVSVRVVCYWSGRSAWEREAYEPEETVFAQPG